MNGIYLKYCDRLFELNEKNKCLYMESLPKKDYFDLFSYNEVQSFLLGKTDEIDLPDTKITDGEYYIGYPYYSVINGKKKRKAPLLFFPVNIEENHLIKHGETLLNRALILSVFTAKKQKKIFEKVSHVEEKISPALLLQILSECGINYQYNNGNKLISFEKIGLTTKPSIKNAAVLGKFPIWSPIQEDYYHLQKNNLFNNAICHLLTGKNKKNGRNKGECYFAEKIDYSQENAIRKSSENLVVFGPPGTGKSQTIAAIIGNVICQKKSTLIVSGKTVALEVLYKRLSHMKNRVFFSVDPERDKDSFYKKIIEAHHSATAKVESSKKELTTVEEEIRKTETTIRNIDDFLHTKTPFGLSPTEMYEKSFPVPKTEEDKNLVDDFLKTSLKYIEYEKLNADVETIKNSLLCTRFIEYKNIFSDNPFASHIIEADISALRDASTCLSSSVSPFPWNECDGSQYILPYLCEEHYSKSKTMIKLFSTFYPSTKKMLLLSVFPVFMPIFPFILVKLYNEKKKLSTKIDRTEFAYKKCISPLLALKKIVDTEGFRQIVFRAFCQGEFKQDMQKTIEDYLTIRELKKLFSEVSPEINDILLFCFEHSTKSNESMLSTLDKIVPLRIYHELKTVEKQTEKIIYSSQHFKESYEKIGKLKEKRASLTQLFVQERINEYYADYALSHQDKTRSFLFYAEQGTLSVKKMFSIYYEHLIRLFPCMLLTPDAVSILPLKKDLFATTVFDEASQLFPESTLPAIFRGKTIVISGDPKQLQPSGGFTQKNSPDCEDDFSDVRSLLDLGMKHLPVVMLKNHYRSNHAELIDFSNRYFYNGELCIAPNASYILPALTWMNVSGRRTERKNVKEADAIIKMLPSLVEKGTVGIIAFNEEQADLIGEKVEKLRKTNEIFCKNYNGFIKSIERVQGEEADTIIFSIGYAPDDQGKIHARFGPLSVHGGEKRVNVAITRAKEKMIIVSGINPEDFPSEGSKNEGPKVLKSFLCYAKNVSEKGLLLPASERLSQAQTMTRTEKELFDRLQSIGYTVIPLVGTSGYHMSMGVFDKEKMTFLIGIECDSRSFLQGGNALERDVDKLLLLESKGWDMVRVRARDWWISPQSVVTNICQAVEKARNTVENSSFSFHTPFANRLLSFGKSGEDGTPEFSKKQ